MKLGGYIGKILRVNLTDKEVEVENLDEERAYNYLGGRGYGCSVLYDELEANIDPLSEENKLVFMTGPLTGTTFPGAGRISVSSKSPLTGTIFDCSMGGSFGVYLKKAGFDGVIVEGKSEKPVYLLIDDGDFSLKDAKDLWGKNPEDVENQLRESHEDSRSVQIGIAGENLVNLSCLISESRAAGRGGLGAVMGSKKLKAIVAKGKNDLEIAHEKEFNDVLKKIRQTVRTNPITGVDGTLSRFGTSLLVHRVNAAGMLPKNNFSGESMDFDEVDSFSGETVYEEYLEDKSACFACPTGCGRIIDTGSGEMKGPEYESVAMLGPNSGFYEYVDEIVPLADLCEEYGLDTISVGNVLGFARDLGMVSNLEEAKEFIRGIAEGETVFSRGVAAAAEEFGNEEKAFHVKGLELPAYDPRGAKGIALAYVTSSRGGCHLRAFTILPEIISNPEFVNPATESGKPKLVREMQDAYAIYDSMIGCKFHGIALFSSVDYNLDDIAEALSALTGFKWSNEDLKEVGSRICTLERLFNAREGFDSEQDRLPEEFDMNLTEMLEEYYEERGWDENGVPAEGVPLREPKKFEKMEVSVGTLDKIDYPQVQVALDMDADIETICEIGKKAYDGGARIIEAGTPALKRHGTDNLIPALREVAPEALVLADLKTMDVGGLEARIAFRPGADISAVLAIGGKNKIKEALSESVQHDGAILIDFIDCADPLEKLSKLVDDLEGYEDRVIFCIHRGISEQLKGRGIYEKKKLLKEARKIAGDFKLAVAGGIKEGVAKEVADAGADICVVGSAIYNSSDPKKTASKILSEIREAKKDD